MQQPFNKSHPCSTFVAQQVNCVSLGLYCFVQQKASSAVLFTDDFLFLFSVNVPPVGYCTLDLTSEFNDALVYAVKNHYWYQMYIGGCGI